MDVAESLLSVRRRLREFARRSVYSAAEPAPPRFIPGAFGAGSHAHILNTVRVGQGVGSLQ